MILFVTAHDEATELNLVVSELLSGLTERVRGENATRTSLWTALNRSPMMPVIVMGHGDRRMLFSQHRELPHAIQIGDEHNLSPRSVFAWACLTSAELGPAVAREGGIWIGFPVKVTAPPDDADLRRMLAEALQIAVDGLPSITDETSCRAMLDHIADAAEAALDHSDTMTIEDAKCFAQIRFHIEAWLPGHDLPVRPTRAPPRRYDLY